MDSVAVEECSQQLLAHLSAWSQSGTQTAAPQSRRVPLELVRERVWELIHTGRWYEVEEPVRELYEAATHVLVAHILRECSTQAPEPAVLSLCLRYLDLALLIGASLLRSYTHQVIDLFHQQLIECRPIPPVSTSRCSAESVPTRCTVRFPVAQVHGDMSLDRFEKLHFNPGKPLHFVKPSFVVESPSYKKWHDPNYLCALAGYRTVPVELGSSYVSSDFGADTLLFGDYIRQIFDSGTQTTSTKPGYLAQHLLFDQIPALRRDIMTPDYCLLLSRDENDEDEQRGSDSSAPLRINCWFGPSHTVSPLHTDPTQNILCQMYGSKYIRLYDAAYTANLYPNAPDTILSNTSQLASVFDVDSERFPLFASAPYQELVLEAGDALFLPPGIWHYVESLSTSLSVSFWWK